ncbi:MAG TPA: hypothetical protein VJ184_15905, partial [Chryseolinea sp.]|nr:hypothetical protein [Chryseolinea sp.]
MKPAFARGFSRKLFLQKHQSCLLGYFYITQQDPPSSIEPVIPRLLAYSVRRLILSGIPGLGPFIKGEGTPAEHVLSTGWRENLAVCYSRLQ